MSINSSNKTFWGLISDYHIVIPKLQRDYAQGRELPEINQIRESLLSELKEALTDNKKVVLNFIYGDRNDKEKAFIPIDGQQRLTTLYLLHWYLFKKADNCEDLEVLKKFSYCTRDSSKRFCEKIIDVSIDFEKESLEEQIKDSYWFSGNFFSDPTIKSMIRVINDIHTLFKDTDEKLLSSLLKREDCPISFLWLPLDDFKNTDDLYIKMNARGKLLTDFEIFKAKLQNSDVLADALGSTITAKERIVFISKYNNQYAELFYSKLGEEYDNSLMDLFRTMIRDDYFTYSCERDVPQKVYRADYDSIKSMNGSMLYRFVEQKGIDKQEYKLCDQSAIIIANSIKSIDRILQMIYDNQKQLNIPEHLVPAHHQTEEELFLCNYSKSIAKDTIIRYSLFKYLLRFGYPNCDEQYNAYFHWKRFIYNLIIGTDVPAHVEYICQTMVIVQNLVNKIDADTEQDVLKMIQSIDLNDLKKWSSGTNNQLNEEICKANLILQNENWKKIILDAEEYFEDGHILFLLEYSQNDDAYDINKFEQGFEKAKKIFGSRKILLTNYNDHIFERALLCSKDDTSNKTGHLMKQSNSSTCYGFCENDFGKLLSNNDDPDAIKKRAIVLDLLQDLNTKDEIDGQLLDIINEFDCGTLDINEKWKEPFIKNDLFAYTNNSNWKFNNCLHLSEDNTEILMLAGTTVRSYSVELNTFILYKKMIDSKLEPVTLHPQTTRDILKDDFPIRYIEYKGCQISYINNNPEARFIMRDLNKTVSFYQDEDAIWNKITSL